MCPQLVGTRRTMFTPSRLRLSLQGESSEYGLSNSPRQCGQTEYNVVVAFPEYHDQFRKSVNLTYSINDEHARYYQPGDGCGPV